MDVSGQIYIQTTLLLAKGTDGHWIGGWVGCSASLDVLENKKVFCFGCKLKRSSLAVQSIA
jgi:hypothetical protein